MSPTRLLYTEDVLGPRTTVVHATHVDDDDLELLGGCQTFACLCPTTERDLGDGLAPARALAAAGCPLTLGSDSHAVIDILEEARGVEYAERLARRARGHFTAEALLCAATMAGHTSLGWPDAGEIAPGALGQPGHRIPGQRADRGRRRRPGPGGGRLRRLGVRRHRRRDQRPGRGPRRGPPAGARRAGGALPLDPRCPRLTAHSTRPASPAGTMVDMTDIPLVDLGGGAVMPMVGFGTWQLGGRRAHEAIRYALEVGYRHIDTATMYRNEHEVGQAIRDSGLDRGEVFVTTKLPPGNAGPRPRHPGREPARPRHRLRGPVADPLAAAPVGFRTAVAGVPRPAGRGPVPQRRGQQLRHRPDRRAHRGDGGAARPSTRSRGARPSTTRPCWPRTPTAA